MARQRGYELDTTISGADRFTGIDAVTGQTVNFNVEDLGNYYARTGTADGSRLGFFYNSIGQFDADVAILPGQMALQFTDDVSEGTKGFSTILKLHIHHDDINNRDLSIVSDLWEDGQIKLSNLDAADSVDYGVYEITDVDDSDNQENVLIFTLSYEVSDGQLADNVFSISPSFFGASAAGGGGGGFDIRAINASGGEFDIDEENTDDNPLTTLGYIDNLTIGDLSGITITDLGGNDIIFHNGTELVNLNIGSALELSGVNIELLGSQTSLGSYNHQGFNVLEDTDDGQYRYNETGNYSIFRFNDDDEDGNEVFTQDLVDTISHGGIIVCRIGSTDYFYTIAAAIRANGQTDLYAHFSPIGGEDNPLTVFVGPNSAYDFDLSYISSPIIPRFQPATEDDNSMEGLVPPFSIGLNDNDVNHWARTALRPDGWGQVSILFEDHNGNEIANNDGETWYDSIQIASNLVGTIPGTGNTFNLGLANTGVTADTYGSATTVGQFTVDAQGRITSASSVTITGNGNGSGTGFITDFVDGLADSTANAVTGASLLVSPGDNQTTDAGGVVAGLDNIMRGRGAIFGARNTLYGSTTLGEGNFILGGGITLGDEDVGAVQSNITIGRNFDIQGNTNLVLGFSSDVQQGSDNNIFIGSISDIEGGVNSVVAIGRDNDIIATTRSLVYGSENVVGATRTTETHTISASDTEDQITLTATIDNDQFASDGVAGLPTRSPIISISKNGTALTNIELSQLTVTGQVITGLTAVEDDVFVVVFTTYVAGPIGVFGLNTHAYGGETGLIAVFAGGSRIGTATNPVNNVTAAGANITVNDDRNVALGQNLIITSGSQDNLVVGRFSEVNSNSDHSVVFGTDILATANSTTLIGTSYPDGAITETDATLDVTSGVQTFETTDVVTSITSLSIGGTALSSGQIGAVTISDNGKTLTVPTTTEDSTNGFDGTDGDGISIGFSGRRITRATEDGAVAIGPAAVVTGSDSTAIGVEALASGTSTTAIGNNAEASGNSASAYGVNAEATDVGATALGASAEASGTRSLSVGSDSEASGARAIVVGDQSTATADDTLALGQDIDVTAANAFSIVGGNVSTANLGVIGSSTHRIQIPGSLDALTINLNDISEISTALTLQGNGSTGLTSYPELAFLRTGSLESGTALIGGIEFDTQNTDSSDVRAASIVARGDTLDTAGSETGALILSVLDANSESGLTTSYMQFEGGDEQVQVKVDLVAETDLTVFGDSTSRRTNTAFTQEDIDDRPWTIQQTLFEEFHRVVSANLALADITKTNGRTTSVRIINDQYRYELLIVRDSNGRPTDYDYFKALDQTDGDSPNVDLTDTVAGDTSTFLIRRTIDRSGATVVTGWSLSRA